MQLLCQTFKFVEKIMFYHKKNILFDLDGTILDSYDGVISSFIETLAHFDHKAPAKEELSWCIGPPLEYSYKILVPNREEDHINRLVEYNRKIYGEKWVFHCKLFPGMRELIAQLANKASLYTATAKPQIYAETILKNLHIDQYFVKIYGSGIDGSFENKSELVSHIFESSNIKAEDSVLIGDTKYDIIAAHNNNLDVIGVKWGYAAEGDFDKYKPSTICSDIKELAS
ncbi:5'-nucleotidase [Candidatus Arcanobacter lacustris]|uniref:5'-nucleotidase n=1 Tax=Candidatus Arcanibacter lacustris TaxID=1607817 RepID=A0A0F5MRY9_9RICK|nr:5'-nucleotidase [Candidatus Arcanobacter lacustris]